MAERDSSDTESDSDITYEKVNTEVEEYWINWSKCHLAPYSGDAYCATCFDDHSYNATSYDTTSYDSTSFAFFQMAEPLSNNSQSSNSISNDTKENGAEQQTNDSLISRSTTYEEIESIAEYNSKSSQSSNSIICEDKQSIAEQQTNGSQSSGIRDYLDSESITDEKSRSDAISIEEIKIIEQQWKDCQSSDEEIESIWQLDCQSPHKDCDYFSSREADLKAREEERSIYCHNCGTTFKYILELNTHIHEAHFNFIRFCQKCYAPFTPFSKHHLQIDVDPDAHLCLICRRSQQKPTTEILTFC